jgi:Heterokaryon incompatibility protein (HET)
MLCFTCRDLIIKYFSHPPQPPAWFEFTHNSFAEVKTSANAGCKICHLVCGVMEEYKYQYKPVIKGASMEQSTILWSNLSINFYSPGKLAATDDQLVACLDASDPESALNKYALHDLEYQYDLQYDVSERTDDERCFELARIWSDTCIHLHPRCARSQNPQLPNRVVDVGLTDSQTDPYLFETKGLKCGQYITLSHRWPPNLNFKTTSLNIDRHRHGMPLPQMPTTFRDAVIVCRKVGIRYLWIDALCILQDSEEDWAIEAPQMGTIYSNATFTISALHTTSSEGGLFSQRPTVRSVSFESPVPGETKGEVVGLRVSLPSFDDDMNGSPLSDRGWIYQERLLSTATLHYGRNQLHWECRTIVSPECSKPIFPPMNAFLYDFSRSLWLAKTQQGYATGEWQEIVAGYSRKQFTIKTDKLAAITTIANRYRDEIFPKSIFIAGLWLQGLHIELIWSHDSRKSTRHLGPPPPIRQNLVQEGWKPRSPSWSWISVDYPTSAMFNSTVGSVIDPDPDFKVLGHTALSPGALSGIDLSAYRHGRAKIALYLQGRIMGLPAGPMAGPARRTVEEMTITLPHRIGYMPLFVWIDPGRAVSDIVYCLKTAHESADKGIPGVPYGWFLILELIPTAWLKDMAFRIVDDATEAAVNMSTRPVLTFRRIGVGKGPKEFVDEYFDGARKCQFMLI